MHAKKILMVGAGKLGYRLAKKLSEPHLVSVLKRSQIENSGKLSMIYADVTDPSSLSGKLPNDIDFIVYCLSPGARTEESYRQTYVEGLQNILEALPEQAKIQHLFFVSSSSVYHQDDASWIDEDSATEPKSFSGKQILKAEQVVQQSDIPFTIVRFSGIYGGNRRQLINSVQEGKAKLSKEPRISNRIHETDCVGFLAFLIEKAASGDKPDALYLASDNTPVDLNEVYQFIANYLDVDLKWASETIHRRTGNKKCRNRKMLETGYTLQYPSFKDGYRESLEQLN